MRDSGHRRRPTRRFRLPAGTFLVALFLGSTAQAALSIYMPPETLAERAPWIVEGIVEAAKSGFDPRTGRLATYVTLQVDVVHRGPARLERVVIREAGGRYAGLIHETDAVPVYEPGERVFVFLEPARDGALRTSGMFFGKFVVEENPDGRGTWARRELDGQGTILRRPAHAGERLALGDLVALATTIPCRSDSRARGKLLAFPPEYDRLLWDENASPASDGDRALGKTGETSGLVDLLAVSGPPPASPAFRPLSLVSPARWPEVDSGGVVVIDIERARNPLGDGASAAAEILRAMAAWNEVPESRLTFAAGDTDFDYTGKYLESPTRKHTGVNIVLFDDPYDDISNPSGCSGVLAIGGYWRTEDKTSTVNGVAFHSAVQLYVIFSNDFECVLGVPDDLAEIAAHELGHGIGIGHSLVDDAIMRSTPYRYRGPRLGDDDRDAAHCYYPHTLHLDSPNGGEVWEEGRSYRIEWSSTLEPGPDPGAVSLEYTTDGALTWSTIADDEPNDGSYDWTVPAAVSPSALVRVVRHSRTGQPSSPFPEACSSDASDAAFEVAPWAARAGAVASGSPAEGGLSLSKAYVEGWVVLNWGASCSPDATDYAVYEGDLAKLRGGVWDHAPTTCTTASGLDETLFTGPGDRYFLVAPLAGPYEGHLGRGSDGELRPVSSLACAQRELSASCE